MDNTIETLLKALQIALFNDNIDITIQNPRKLYTIAKANGLSGTIYGVVKDSLNDEKALSKFKKEFFLYISDDSKKTEVKNIITNKFNELCINHIYLKGMRIKELYPKSYMRSMGDIDLLIKEDDFDKAEKELIKSGFNLHSRGPVHNQYFYGKTEVELHRTLRQKDKFDEFKILDKVWDSVQEVSSNEYRIKPEVELVYLIFHLKKHLLVAGVGLRNILDIGIYVNCYQNEINFDLLNKILIETNSGSFFEQLILFNEKYLNIPLSQKCGITAKFDNELYEVFTQYIIKSGVHGLGVSFNTFVSRFAANKNNNTKNGKSFSRMVFPSYNTMKYKYPKLCRYKVFLPLGWIRRGINVLFKKNKRIVAYSKQIKSVDTNDVVETSKLFKKMGI